MGTKRTRTGVMKSPQKVWRGKKPRSFMGTKKCTLEAFQYSVETLRTILEKLEDEGDNKQLKTCWNEFVEAVQDVDMSVSSEREPVYKKKKRKFFSITQDSSTYLQEVETSLMMADFCGRDADIQSICMILYSLR